MVCMDVCLKRASERFVKTSVAVALIAFAAMSTTALAQTEEFAPVPEPPVLPARVESGEILEPDITIVTRQEETIVEYRIAGRLRAIKVIPKNDAFPPYYLVDIDGDGRLETHESNLAPDVLVNMWTLFSWD
jgi:hypothetical protein